MPQLPAPSDALNQPEASELAEELSWSERTFGFKGWKFLLALVSVILVAFYISNLLFGNASLEVLMKLETYRTHLKTEIDRLKEENAKLQKEYFELRELSPSSDK